MKLSEKEKYLGADLHCYASGSGALSFVFSCNKTSNALGIRVTRKDVEEYLKNNPNLKEWKILYKDSHYYLYEPCIRVSPNEVMYKGESYHYISLNEQNFIVTDCEDNEIKNYNIVGAIKFFVNNEGYL